MNTRLVLAALALAIIALPVVAPLVSAQTIAVEVSAEYLNYNIILLKIKNLPAGDPPAVKVTVYDADGNPIGATDVNPILLISGYRSGSWIALIALKKTFDNNLFSYAVANASNAYINTTDGTIYTFNGTTGLPLGNVSAYFGVDFANPDAIAISTPYVIAVDGKKIAYIDNNGTRLGARDAWPVVNALRLSSNAASLEIKVETAAHGSDSVTVKLGSAGFQANVQEYLNIAPEKEVAASIVAPTVAADPTAANSLAYKATPGFKLETNGTTSYTFNAVVTAAQKAAALETGLPLGTQLTVTLANTSSKATLSIAANNPIPASATIYVKLGLQLIYTNANGVVLNVSKNAFIALDDAHQGRTILTLDGLDLTNGNLTVVINCYKVVVVPAAVSANINGLTGTAPQYTTALSGVTLTSNGIAKDFVFIDALEGTQDSGFTAIIRMVGRDDVPSYDAIKEEYAKNDAPVVLTFKDIINTETYINAFIKLQTGTLTVAPTTVKPGDTFTISLEDIDAYLPTATVKLLDANGNTVASAVVSLKAGKEEGKFSASFKVILGTPGIDTTNGIIRIDNNIKKINVTYIDKYGEGGSQVPRKSIAKTAFWPVEFSGPDATYKGARIDLSLVSKNFNNNANKIETIRLAIVGNAAQVLYGPDQVLVGEITAYIAHPDGSTTQINLGDAFIVKQFFESGKDTGSYTIFFYTEKLPIANGDVIVITYKDILNNDKYTVKIAVQVFTGKVCLKYGELNITGLPIAAAPNAVVYREFSLTVRDPDANQNISATDLVPVDIAIVHQDASVSKITVNLAETDVSTGVFTGIFNVTYDSKTNTFTIKVVSGGSTWTLTDDIANLPLAKIVISYYDQSAKKTIAIEVPFKQPSAAALDITPTVVPSLNDNVVITLTEPDLDIVPGAENDKLPENLTFTVSINGAATATLTVGQLAALDYTFTEVEPGVFKLEIPASKILGLLFGDPLNGLNANIELSYTDPVAPGSVQGSLVPAYTSAAFRVQSHDAKLTVEPKKVSPFGSIVIKIEDPDLAGRTVGYIFSNSRLSISSSLANIPVGDLTLVYPKSNLLPSENGTFILSLNIGKEVNAGRVNAIADILVVVYRDDNPAEGSAKVLMESVEVYSELGRIVLPNEVSLGTINITVEDFDQNKNPADIDTVQVSVWSSTLPQKRTLTLAETGLDTGVFSAPVRVTDNPAEINRPNTIYAPPGSIIYVEYKDSLAPNATQLPVVVRAEAKVVAKAAMEMPAVPETNATKLLDPETLKPIEAVKAGKQALLVIPVENMADRDVTVYAAVTIYKEGVPVAFSFSVGVLKAGAVVDLPVTLPALPEPGTYTVRVVLVDGLETLNPLSRQPVELTITVQ